MLGYNFDFPKNESSEMNTGQAEIYREAEVVFNRREIISDIEMESTPNVGYNNSLSGETVNSDKLSKPIKPFNIDTDIKHERGMKFNIIFSKYKKLFLVEYKSLRPPKNLKERDYQQIIKYL